MDSKTPKAELPPIPAKRYFTIGEVSDLCEFAGYRRWYLIGDEFDIINQAS